MKITISIYDSSNDSSFEHEFPAKMAVCWDCEGHGWVLCPGMRDHVYTASEFAESFDDESAEEYFKRGGIYDVKCECCRGLRVVPVVDESQFDEEDSDAYALYRKDQHEQEMYEMERAAERRMGC